MTNNESVVYIQNNAAMCGKTLTYNQALSIYFRQQELKNEPADLCDDEKEWQVEQCYVQRKRYNN